MSTVKPVTELTTASSAVAGNQALVVQGGALVLVDVATLPVPTAVSTAIAAQQTTLSGVNTTLSQQANTITSLQQAVTALQGSGGSSGSGGSGGSGGSSGGTGTTTSMTALAAALGKGVNIGNCLDAPLEGDWGPAFVDGWAAIIKSAGFTTVRLPVRFSNHAAVTADATLDATFLARVDHIIATLLAQGLYVILDGLHWYKQLDGDALDTHETAVDAGVVQTRAVNIWKQLGAHYASYSNKLLFELHNEPHGILDTPDNGVTFNGGPWNLLYPQLLAAVRLTNPTRAVLIGPGNYNNASFLQYLTPPTDPYVIVTVHNYLPIAITLQGSGGQSYPYPVNWDGDSSQFVIAMNQAVDYRTRTGLPIYVGEFGMSAAAPAASRQAWLLMARQQIESRGMSWAVWNFDSDFALYDTTANAWNTALLSILMGSSSVTLTAPTIFGVNIKNEVSPTQTGSPEYPPQGGVGAANQAIVDVCSARGLKTMRVGMNLDTGLDNQRDLMTRGRAVGISFECDLEPGIAFDHTVYTGADLAIPGGRVYSTAYNDTATIVQRIGDLCTDFELLNELQYRSEIVAQLTPGAATTVAAYAGLTSYASIVVALKGMSQAIKDQAAATGRPYRIILGGIQFPGPFFQFMQSQGVPWDVTGFHIYPSLKDPVVGTDTFFGTGGLMAQLQQFGKPIRINEFNAGDIYGTQNGNIAYDDVAGSTSTNNGIKAIDRHISSLKVSGVEAIQVYSLLNQSQKTAPENHFGLMYDINTPKLSLAIISAYAGGLVTSAEKTALAVLSVFTGSSGSTGTGTPIGTAPALQGQSGTSTPNGTYTVVPGTWTNNTVAVTPGAISVNYYHKLPTDSAFSLFANGGIGNLTANIDAPAGNFPPGTQWYCTIVGTFGLNTYESAASATFTVPSSVTSTPPSLSGVTGTSTPDGDYTIVPATYVVNGSAATASGQSWDYYRKLARDSDFSYWASSGSSGTAASIDATNFPPGTQWYILDKATAGGISVTSQSATFTVPTTSSSGGGGSTGGSSSTFTVASRLRVDQTFASQVAHHLQHVGSEFIDTSALTEAGWTPPSGDGENDQIFGSYARFYKTTYFGRTAIVHTLSVNDGLFSSPNSRRLDIYMGGDNSLAQGDGMWFLARLCEDPNTFSDANNFSVRLDFHGGDTNGGVYLQTQGSNKYGGTPAAAMMVEVIRNPGGSPGTAGGYDQINIGSSWPAGTWLDVALYFRPSVTNGQGLVEVWVRPTGSTSAPVMVAQSTNANLSTAADAPVYAKFALYYPTSAIPAAGARVGYTDIQLVRDNAHAADPATLMNTLIG